MLLDAITPRKFLCRWELKTGAKIVGLCMCVLMAVCTVAAIVQTVQMSKCIQCDLNSWKNAYGFSVTTIVYCVIIFVINVWFLWGVKKEKATVVLSWVVVTVAWMAQTICLLIVLLCMYSSVANAIAWIICLVFSFLAFCIFFYGLLVGYGYWLQLKNKPNADIVTNA